MGFIWDKLAVAYAVMAFVPFVPFMLIFLWNRARGGDRKRGVRLAMDVTTIFLIGGVGGLLNKLLGTHFGLYFILLIMLIGGGLIGNAQNRIRGKVDGKKLFRAVWRLSFFSLSMLYVILMLAEVIRFAVHKSA